MRYLCAVLAMAVGAGSVAADVIGSRPADRKAAENRKVVAERLSDLGLRPSAVNREVSEMSAGDLAFFAEKTERIVMAGQETSLARPLDDDKIEAIDLIHGAIWLAAGVTVIIIAAAQ